ncbi:hypothetical protein CTI12_AA527700 [Artemisia annua]|uniref:Uncharacterized protein n=1 Tax=Artemisia annua TaxID=35608 RepID=A0A2U1L5L8_ARTAN|nr:hypothetical protein CTI12_AA527700 [Artemisia annua]
MYAFARKLESDTRIGIVPLTREPKNIPKYGIFENINSVKELAQMPQWTAEKPGFHLCNQLISYLGPKFLKDNGLQHVAFSTADGALEAAPARFLSIAF